jgi:hypothetical protein
MYCSVQASLSRLQYKNICLCPALPDSTRSNNTQTQTTLQDAGTFQEGVHERLGVIAADFDQEVLQWFHDKAVVDVNACHHLGDGHQPRVHGNHLDARIQLCLDVFEEPISVPQRQQPQHVLYSTDQHIAVARRGKLFVWLGDECGVTINKGKGQISLEINN